jgi:hypothetical protein
LVRDPGHLRAAVVLAVASLVVLLLAVACSGGDSGEAPETTGEATGPKRDATRPGTEGTTSAPEATLGTGSRSPGVVLRIEGDPGTTFSGICSAGGGESVLSGQVPKRYTFDLDAQRLSCRIQKQDSANGDLKVILTTGNTTRSVQQTSSRNSIINVSYQGN